MKKASHAKTQESELCRGAACGDRGNSAARSAQAPTLQEKEGGGWTLWLWVGAGFLFMALLWTGMVVATRQADTRTVPLATKGGGAR